MTELKKVTTLNWRKFLGTDAGLEGQLFLREREPSISPGEPHRMIFEAGKVEGYKMAINMISEILTLVKDEKEINIEN